jgi:hypothetical protein
MANYIGKLTLDFTVQNKDTEEVNRIIWRLLDELDIAKPNCMEWRNAEWNGYQEEEGNNN